MGYDAEIDLRNANTSHAVLLQLVGPGRRVLDVGCGPGRFGAALVRQGCRVAGVERDPEAAEAARQVLDEVLVGDVDDLDLVDHFGKESFDVVVFGDVLEQVADPVDTLRGVGPLLAQDGSVVASIANVAHGAVRLALLKGRFEYRSAGLLDAAHLRFFTRGSMYETFREAGFVPVDVRRTTAGVFDTEIDVRREDFDPGVVDAVEGDPDSTTYGFVLRAVPEDSAEAIAAPAPAPAALGRSRPHVAVCADWDPDDLWTALAVRVTAGELARRLPGAVVRVLAGGRPRPTAHDGGLAVEALEGADLAGLDCVVVTGDAGRAGRLPLEAGLDCPVVWGEVRDAGAPTVGGGEAGGAAGSPTARHEAAAEALPDPVLLVPRLLPAEALSRRLAFARSMGWFPATGRAVVVEVDRTVVPHAAAVARLLDAVVAATGVAVVLVDPEPGGGAVDKVAEAMATPAHRVPADAVVDDVVAVVAGSTALAASSRLTMALGAAYGVPTLRFDHRRTRDHGLEQLAGLVTGEVRAAPAPDGVEAMRAALDAHLDRAAALAGATAAARSPGVAGGAEPAEYVAALVDAHRRMRDRLIAERLAVADLLEGYEAEYGPARELARRLRAERDELRSRLDEASARQAASAADLERLRAELDALRNTKVLRLLRPARAVYARLRGGRL